MKLQTVVEHLATNPCHYHPCHAEIPEPNTAILFCVAALMAIGYFVVFGKRKNGKKEGGPGK